MIVTIQIRFEDCDGNWRLISSDDIKADESIRTITLILDRDHHKLTGVSYLWDQDPVKGYLTAPIYSSDIFR